MDNRFVSKKAAVMRRVSAGVLAGVMMLGATAPAFAKDTITDPNSGNTSTHDVTLTFAQNQSVKKVYSVDVEWGDLEGTYTSSATDTWKPEDHTYETSAEGTYAGFDGTAITVTNHSNAAVKVGASYQAEPEYDDIKVQFSEQEKTLATAVGTAVDNAPKAEITMTLSGNASNLLSQVAGAKKIGVATVTVSAAN